LYERLHRRAGEIAGEDNTVFDLDVEVVEGDFEIGHRLPHRAGAEVFRLFRLQILSTKNAGDRAVDAVGAGVEWLDQTGGRIEQEVGADGREVPLAERRRAEAGA